MKLVIHTQHQENYGDSKTPFWKFKGGNVYIVNSLTERNIKNIKEKGIPTLRGLIESSNSGFIETVVSAQVVNDSAITHDEWETPWMLSYEDGKWVAKRTVMNDGMFREGIESKTEQYDMLPNGERTNYKAVFVLDNGRNMTYDQLTEYFKAA